jgi:YD repeat-containing protein
VTVVSDHARTNVPKLNGDVSQATSGNLERAIEYAYDAANQMLSASDPDSAYTYTYDNLGRLRTVDSDGTPGVPIVSTTPMIVAPFRTIFTNSWLADCQLLCCPWAKMLKARVPNVVTYVKHHISNAISEGFNSRIQANARGFSNFDNYLIRILFFGGKLDLTPDAKTCH